MEWWEPGEGTDADWQVGWMDDGSDAAAAAAANSARGVCVSLASSASHSILFPTTTPCYIAFLVLFRVSGLLLAFADRIRITRRASEFCERLDPAVERRP